MVRVLFHEDVLAVIRRELNRAAPARLEMQDVFAVRDTLSKEALAEAGELGVTKRRRRRRKVQRTDVTTGQTVTEEVDDEDDAGPEAAVGPVEQAVTSQQVKEPGEATG